MQPLRHRLSGGGVAEAEVISRTAAAAIVGLALEDRLVAINRLRRKRAAPKLVDKLVRGCGLRRADLRGLLDLRRLAAGVHELRIEAGDFALVGSTLCALVIQFELAKLVKHPLRVCGRRRAGVGRLGGDGVAQSLGS